jgi:hypothetical protein
MEIMKINAFLVKQIIILAFLLLLLFQVDAAMILAMIAQVYKKINVKIVLLNSI